jgi:IclR family transcriptional regulator, blcABC operon repressor
VNEGVSDPNGRPAAGGAGHGHGTNLRDVSSSAPAVTRAAALLGVLAEPGVGPMGPSDLARRLGLPKSSIANLCSALEGVGFVTRIDGRYELGPRLLELGGAYLRQTDALTAFRDTCRRLPTASQETVQFATLDGMDVVYLARHDGSQPIRLASDIGGRMPAMCTGLGKAMLSRLDPHIAEDRLRQTSMFPALTHNSIRNVPDLMSDLERTRERGYAIDDEENTIGVVCFAVALPGTDRAGRQRAVSVTMLKARATDALRDAIVADLTELARTLSPAL